MAVATSTIIAGAALGVAAAGTAASIVQGRKARKAQKKARQVERRRADIQALQGRRQAVAQAQQARASIAAQAAQQGVAGASAPQGAQATVGAQTGANIGFAGVVDQLTQRQFDFLQQATNAQGKANTFGAVSNFAFSVASFAGSSAGSSKE